MQTQISDIGSQIVNWIKFNAIFADETNELYFNQGFSHEYIPPIFDDCWKSRCKIRYPNIHIQNEIILTFYLFASLHSLIILVLASDADSPSRRKFHISKISTSEATQKSSRDLRSPRSSQHRERSPDSSPEYSGQREMEGQTKNRRELTWCIEGETQIC
jgi:hypothetical protein